MTFADLLPSDAGHTGTHVTFGPKKQGHAATLQNISSLFNFPGEERLRLGRFLSPYFEEA